MKIRGLFTSILGLVIAIIVSLFLFKITMELTSGDEIVSIAAAVVGFWFLFDLLIDLSR